MATPHETNDQPESRPADLKETVETPSVDSVGKPENSTAGGESPTAEGPVNMEFLLDIPLEITVELGRTKMLINDMLKLGQGSSSSCPNLPEKALRFWPIKNRSPEEKSWW